MEIIPTLESGEQRQLVQSLAGRLLLPFQYLSLIHILIDAPEPQTAEDIKELEENMEEGNEENEIGRAHV